MTLSAIARRYADALADVVTRSGSALAPQDAAVELRAFQAAPVAETAGGDNRNFNRVHQ